MEQRVVVIGAGQAGFEVCAQLRARGMTGPITLVGEESDPPYQRPPLSKSYLLGKMARERLYFRPPEFYEAEGIDLRTNFRCVAIDPNAKTVTLGNDDTIAYDTLVLATGARPLSLPEQSGGNLSGVFLMRTIADADRMATGLRPGMSVLVVGGGYIGLEAAAVASGLGLHVTVIEAADRILQRVASAETSEYFRQLHRANGVTIREGAKLDRFLGQGGTLTGARLGDGTELAVEVAIVGIGIRPNVELAEAAGLTIENGIAVDEYCRTSDSDIFAVGDCASFPHAGERLRLESVGNAIDQAQAGAAVIAGAGSPYVPKPWFWSDQYDTKLQIAGLSSGYDKIVSRTDPDKPGAQSIWYYSGEQLLAVDAMNDPRAYMVGKRLIEAGRSPGADKIADPSQDLKSFLR